MQWAGVGLISGWGTKILSAVQCGQKMKVTMRLFSTIRLAIIQTLENKCVDKGSIYRFQEKGNSYNPVVYEPKVKQFER